MDNSLVNDNYNSTENINIQKQFRVYSNVMIRDKCLNGTYWWFKHYENVTNETNETKSF